MKTTNRRPQLAMKAETNLLMMTLFLLLIAIALHSNARAQRVVGGVYEVCIGTRDAATLIAYWERFGYRVGEQGALDAEQARRLYGVASAVRSIRLHHQDADHGLIRLMVWERPTGEGLGLIGMKTLGNRWGAMLTADIYNVLNHAEEAAARGLPILYVEPQRAEIYRVERRPRPFLDDLPCVREMLLIQPLTRQVLFQRFGYTLPLYGKINEAAPFRTSQITHFGMVVQTRPDALDFYDKVLGLLRVRDQVRSRADDPSARRIFDLSPGESYVTTDFDDPRSAKDDPQRMRSGRLKIINFAPHVRLEDRRAESRPGSLGYSLYTLRVNDIEAYHRRLRSSAATGVTEITLNEFGERSFSFVAPDGYFWTLIEQR